MATEIEAAQLLVWKACSLIDQEQDCTKLASITKIFTRNIAQKATSIALDIMGARNFTIDSPINVHFRDAKVRSILEGTTNIQKLIISSSP